jgi:3-phenylpropionate/trans-cinnamate dioxygenase ferredoxin reductase subunit
VPDPIVIAGGGLAGQRAVETLRRSGHDGPVVMACAETHRPYDRPPLSKQTLSGEDAADVFFRAPGWYEEHDVELRLGVRATALASGERRVALSDGSRLRYTSLLIATGSRPRRLAALEGHDNVSYLRTLDDALALRGAIAEGRRLAVIGAGFVGQEVTATARAAGAEVTLIESAPAPLIDVLGPLLGGWFSRLHVEEGVEVLLGRQVQRVIAGSGGVRALHLSDGTVVATDHVLVGIGVEPDLGWLAGSRLELNGVRVDDCGRSDAPDVYAAGDAAAPLDPVAGRHLPGGHWESAARQGARGARAMLGLDPGRTGPSSFWTDQYGLRVQYLGHAPLHDEVSIDGELEARDFRATFTRGGVPVAVLLVGRPHDLPDARRLIAEAVAAPAGARS